MTEGNVIKWISHERISDTGEINLICFPYAGGSSTYFAPLKAHIDRRINVLPVLYPGHEKNIRIKPFDTVEETAYAFAKDNPGLFDGRYAFLGHCTGSLFAYETALSAQQLYGTRAELLIASSSPAPSCEQFFPKKAYTDAELKEHLVQSGMIDSEFAEDEFFSSYFLPLLKKDLDMHLKYTPASPCRKTDTPVLVMYGSDDEIFRDEETINRWADFTDREVSAKRFRGGHFYIDSDREEAGKAISDALL